MTDITPIPRDVLTMLYALQVAVVITLAAAGCALAAARLSQTKPSGDWRSRSPTRHTCQ